MRARPRLVTTVVAIALSLGCQDASSPAAEWTAFGSRTSVSQPDSSAVIVHEYYSGLVDAADLVISDSQTWAAMWARLNAGRQPPPPLPAVDFLTERVILVALGQRNSGGYDIRVDSVVHFERGSVTYVTATAPGSRCGVTGALTQPVDVRRLSSRVGPMAFQQRDVVRDCP
jgi:protease stability complex PrcB-like protein